jgi:hypothetical protein
MDERYRQSVERMRGAIRNATLDGNHARSGRD